MAGAPEGLLAKWLNSSSDSTEAAPKPTTPRRRDQPDAEQDRLRRAPAAEVPELPLERAGVHVRPGIPVAAIEVRRRGREHHRLPRRRQVGLRAVPVAGPPALGSGR